MIRSLRLRIGHVVAFVGLCIGALGIWIALGFDEAEAWSCVVNEAMRRAARERGGR